MPMLFSCFTLVVADSAEETGNLAPRYGPTHRGTARHTSFCPATYFDFWSESV